MPLFNENSKIFKDYDLASDEDFVSAEFYEDSFVISVSKKISDDEYVTESYSYDLSEKSDFKNIVIIVLVCALVLAFAIIVICLEKRKKAVPENVSLKETEEAEDKNADEGIEKKTE